ncbi:MAG: fused MFS/spermidine synthase, partial [Deltaproteobacteria bacterium]|nr:fused MFS/spermidine synthase [Deltaproteobacteria bacterium]
TLEVGVAVLAAVSPFAIDGLGAGYLALGGTAALGGTPATLLRLGITVIAIGPAVVLMGGTLPAAARAVEVDDDAARGRLALLYGVNTLGAVAGSVAGTFLLFELLGTRSTLLAAALVNLLVGVVARGLGRRAAPLPVAPKEAAAFADPERPPLAALVVAGGVGAAFLLLEIVWYRLLAPILGGSTYTFGLVLAVALAGIGLGGAAYAVLRPGRPASLSELSAVTALEALFVAVPLALGDRIAVFAALTRPLGNLGFASLVASWTLVTAAVVLPAAIVSGYQFPLLFALLGRGREGVARHVGLLYAWNTVGSIAGSLLGGFLLLPHVGAVGAFRLVVWVLLALALLSSVRDLRERGRRALPALAATLALALVAGALARAEGPTAVFRHQAIGAGRANVPTHSRNALERWMRQSRAQIVWEKDGVESAVALDRRNQLAFVVDGKIDGGVFADRATQAGSGLIAALVHGAPRRALVVGLGTGMTAGWLAAVPGMERVDVAELEPSILEVARRARLANQDVLARPNVHVHLGDGRELVMATRERYDVIVSEPSNPYRAGIASLYTLEFYRAVERALAPGGLFVQWIQGYEVDASTVRSVARTLGAVLPHLELWQSMYGDLLFLAGREPRRLDVARIRADLAREPFRSGAPRSLHFEEAEGLVGRFVAGAAAVAALGRADDAELITDDRNVLEYAFARAVGTTDASLPQKLLLAASRAGADRPDADGEIDWARVEALRYRAWTTDASRLPSLPGASPVAEARAGAVSEACAGDLRATAELWRRAGSPSPVDSLERFAVGSALAEAGDPAAPELADRLGGSGFVAEAALVRARYALRKDGPAAALEPLVTAIATLREDALPLCEAAEHVAAIATRVVASEPSLGRRLVEELLAAPFGGELAHEVRIRAAQRLASALRDPALCVRALGDEVERPLWEEAFLEERLGCLAAAGHPLAESAAADLLAFRRATVGSFELAVP